MMRKRWILAAVAAAAVGLVCSEGWSQVSVAAPTVWVAPPAPTVTYQPACPNLPPGQKCIILHKVGRGEDLHILAAYYYGDARAWPRIYNLNRRQIANPNRIREGQILQIEVPQGWVPRFDLQWFLRIEAARREIYRPAIAVPPGTQVIQSHETVKPLYEIDQGEAEEAPKPTTPGAPGAPAPKPKPAAPAAGTPQ